MSNSGRVRPNPPSEKLARRRAELILKVRAGLLTASAAAAELGVSYQFHVKRRVFSQLNRANDLTSSGSAIRLTMPDINVSSTVSKSGSA